MASTLYLETYVESTSSLPTELQRLLTTIKALDERSAVLLEQVREASQAIIDMPPPTTRKMREEQAAEIKALQERIQADEAMLMQFMEEKCQLAQQSHDLLEMHSQELDQVLETFESEMAHGAPQPAAQAPNEYNPFEYGGGGGGRRGKQYNDQWDSLEPLPAPTLKRHVQPAQAMPNKGKRQREEQLPPPHTARLSSASATAAVLADQDPYAALPAGTSSSTLPGLNGGLNGGLHGGLGVLGTGLDGAPDGIPSIPPAVTMSFMHNEKTAGLKDSAPQPQLPGRLLNLGDINPELAGRQAEMFWPDDNMWYLIEIHVVHVETRRATIVYRTGEVEDLDLQEIAQEGHMSLISDV